MKDKLKNYLCGAKSTNLLDLQKKEYQKKKSYAQKGKRLVKFYAKKK